MIQWKETHRWQDLPMCDYCGRRLAIDACWTTKGRMLVSKCWHCKVSYQVIR